MAALTANRRVPNIVKAPGGAETGFYLDIPLGSGEEIYIGAFVSLDSGYAAPLAAGEGFVGIATERKTGGSTDGAEKVRVWTGGLFQHAVGSVAAANHGAIIYASDDQTLTLTSTSNSPVGRAVSVPETGTAVIQTKPIGETLE